MTKIFLIFLVTLSLALPLMVLAAGAYSEAQNNLAPFEDVFGAPPDNPAIIAINIIHIILGFLGVIFLGLMLYAGFLWMTAGGKEDQVGKAKKILLNSTIGLGIILAAWTITSFVICYLFSATSDGYMWECLL